MPEDFSTPIFAGKENWEADRGQVKPEEWG